MSRFCLFLFTSILLLRSGTACGQHFRSWVMGNADSSYVADYPKLLTLRGFFSRKLITYQAGIGRNRVAFAPNDNVNIGVGFAYKWLALNGSFRMPFINNDDDVYGRTSLIDLATYIYLRKFAVDLMAQYFKGYYNSNSNITTRRFENTPYPLRPDLRTVSLGLNVQYIFNHSRFSYRAAFMQNEWQKKSAGSWLVGGGISHYRVKADSSIISPELHWAGRDLVTEFTRSKNWSLGLQAGYGYTLVVHEHWFATAALAAGPGIAFTTIGNKTARSGDQAGWHMNASVRMATGYNSERLYVGILFVDFVHRNNRSFKANDIWQQQSSGMFRLMTAIRFLPKPKAVRNTTRVVAEASGISE